MEPGEVQVHDADAPSGPAGRCRSGLLADTHVPLVLYESGFAPPDKVEITIDGQKLEPVPGQTVIAHGPDRNLSVDDVGGIRLSENESPASASLTTE
jgi:hypothetical protein